MGFSQSHLLDQLPKQFFADLVAKVNAQVAAGHDVINLGQGNPDQPTYDFIVEAMAKASRKPLNHKYSNFRGQTSLKEAIATFYKRQYGVDLDPETEVCILGGAKIGLVEFPLALMNPGEKLLLPNPGYPDYLSGSVLGQVDYDTFPLLAENDFLPDYASFSDKLLDKATFLYLNYPNNPTGAVASAEFYDQTVAFAKKNGLGIVSDLAYGALGADGYDNPSFLSSKGAKDVGIELYTFSKTFNMAGWRLAFAVGNKDMISALNLLQDHLFVSVFPAIQEAGRIALLDERSDDAIYHLNKLYDQRRHAFVEAAAEIGWYAYPSKGSFYAWMPVPKGHTSETFADFLLEEAKVAVAPGLGFGAAGDGYVRIGLLESTERLLEAVERIKRLDLF